MAQLWALYGAQFGRIFANKLIYGLFLFPVESDGFTGVFLAMVAPTPQDLLPDPLDPLKSRPDLQKNRAPPSPPPPAPQKNWSDRSISKSIGAALHIPVLRPVFPLDFQTKLDGRSDRFQNRSVRPISEMIGATLHARGSEVAPLPPTLHTTKKSVGLINFKIGRGHPVAGEK